VKSLSERMTIPELIVYISKFMFDRSLIDLAGGNTSARDGDTIYMTPTLAGTAYHWNIGVEDVIIGSISNIDELKKHPRFSREGLTHLAIYKAFPFVRSVIHAHPFYVLPFTATCKPIPAILNASKEFGTLQYHPEAPSYSQQQADYVVELLKDKQEQMKKKAAAVLMPRHGIILAGGDLITTLDCLQRMNTNAFAVLAQKWID
jgi:L-fuculose-phosphate aldolase